MYLFYFNYNLTTKGCLRILSCLVSDTFQLLLKLYIFPLPNIFLIIKRGFGSETILVIRISLFMMTSAACLERLSSISRWLSHRSG